MAKIVVACASFLFASSLAVFGCSSKSSTSGGNGGAADDPVNGGSDSSETETNAESLASSFISGTGTGTGALSLGGRLELTGGGDLHAQTAGEVTTTYYKPAGCLVVTDVPAQKQASYVFNDCTGPYGLVHVTGTVNVGYSSSAANQLTLSYSSTGLKINNASIDWAATANITANGSSRDMVWNGHFTGTTGHGRAIERTNQKEYKWTVGGDCLSVSGSSDGTVTGHELKVDVINYSRCKGACPETGSEIKITDVTSSKVYDLKYGVGSATYTGPNGGSITFTPWCAL
jgi:hypothetical protein